MPEFIKVDNGGSSCKFAINKFQSVCINVFKLSATVSFHAEKMTLKRATFQAGCSRGLVVGKSLDTTVHKVELLITRLKRSKFQTRKTDETTLLLSSFTSTIKRIR